MNDRESVPAVRVERIIPAPPHRVYLGLARTRAAAPMDGPGPFELSRAEVDERVGGHYRIWHAADGTEAAGSRPNCWS